MVNEKRGIWYAVNSEEEKKAFSTKEEAEKWEKGDKPYHSPTVEAPKNDDWDDEDEHDDEEE